MKRRVVWGESFWIFWKSVRCFNSTSTHDFQAQHKSHIGKEMYIAITGFRRKKKYMKFMEDEFEERG